MSRHDALGMAEIQEGESGDELFGDAREPNPAPRQKSRVRHPEARKICSEILLREIPTQQTSRKTSEAKDPRLRLKGTM